MSRSYKGLLFGAAVAAAAMISPAYADLSGSASAHVRVNVNPNVSVTSVLPTIDAGTVQTGNFTATIVFRVDANQEQVSFSVDASPLYKGDDPTSSIVAPIGLNVQAGVLVQPDNGNATGGASNTLIFLGSPGPVIQGFPTSQTVLQAFESSQNNHFSQNVTVKVTWNQTDAELPTGEYSGVVQLNILIVGS